MNDAEYKWAVDCSFGEEKTDLIKIASDFDNGKTFGVSAPFHIKGSNCYSTYSGGPSNYLPKTTSYLSRPSGYPSKSAILTRYV